jgi:hypothetical protein
MIELIEDLYDLIGVLLVIALLIAMWRILG